MTLKRRVKAPKAVWGQGGKGSKMPSSVKKPRARGINPGGATFGILNTSKGNELSNGAKGNGMFGISRSPGKGQSKLISKVKRFT